MSITINTCAKCGHEWPQSSKVPPRRCPAPGCRTVRWREPIIDDATKQRVVEKMDAFFKAKRKAAK